MKKILIVEDDQIVANIYRNKFSVEGFQVEVALDGESGLETARTFRPDAVILDLMLPKMTGVELMKRIRAENGLEKTPVIVFSNTYLTNLVQEAWKAGATKCLSKANCTPKQVIDAVRSTFPTNGTSNHTTSSVHKTPVIPNVAALGTAPAPELDACAGSDVQFQEELRQSFVDSLPATLSSIRASLKDLIKAQDEPGRLKQAHDLYRRVHALTGNAGIVGLHEIAQMSDALEALLKELHEKPKNMNASTLRTVASAVDFLALLCERSDHSDREEPPPARVLVVDDEAISRRAVTHAIEKAKLKAISVEDPLQAEKLLTENPFDLVFLDVDMPGMTGFELCSRLRNLPAHKTTPVVFVTSLNDFESRANSTMSGGNDFIAKPFLFMELAVKALVHLLRSRQAKKKEPSEAVLA
jgi:DNA-binding response OmpR family regulator